MFNNFYFFFKEGYTKSKPLYYDGHLEKKGYCIKYNLRLDKWM